MTEEKRNYILYRVFDAHEVLLYIGMSKAFVGRLQAHIKGSDWFSMASKITLEHCDSLEELTLKEVSAIKSESPKFNRKDSLIYEKPARKYKASKNHIFVVKHFKTIEKIDFPNNEIFQVLNLDQRPNQRLLNDLEKEISKYLCQKFNLSRSNLDSLYEFIELKEKKPYSKSNYAYNALIEENLIDVQDGYLILSKDYFRKSGE